ncbi:vegetative incompatibility protein het-e-1 [Colletotrichum incanum]|nr:vegetative incompatibility protein het-e-1 [Colletotrichum incanum]
MRLLHTTRLEVVYVATDVPPYAILSHTWDDEEATFQDVQSSGIAKQMRGYAKLEESCSLASGEGFEYIWVDSCCIDKTSSAELSEAVNSMFRWYREAQICCAMHIRSSRWFTRGWALQEPTAPKTIHFYNQHWSLIGTRDDSARVLAMITFIPEGILVGGELPRTPINQRRHWSFWDVLAEDRLRFSGPVPGFRERTSLTQLQDSSVNITNRGVAVKWYVVPLPYDTSETVFLALLTECGGVSDGIFIQRRNHEGSVFSLIVPLRASHPRWLGRAPECELGQRHLYTEDRVMHRLKSLMTPWAMAPHHKDLGLVNSVLTADGLKFSSLTPFTKVLGCSRVEVEAEVAIVRKELMESSSHALLDM